MSNKCFSCIHYGKSGCTIKEPCKDRQYYKYLKQVIAMKKEHLVDYNGVCKEVKTICKIFDQNEPIKNIIKWGKETGTINITITLEEKES